MSRFSGLKLLFRRRRKQKDDVESHQPPEPQVTFPQFMRLPPELRLRVWHLVMPPQVLHFSTPRCELKSFVPGLLRFSHLQSPILSVCREAWESRISCYKTTFQFRSYMKNDMPREPLYWDPHTDLIVLHWDPEHHLRCVPTGSLFDNSPPCAKPDFYKPLRCMDDRVRFLGFRVDFETDEEWDLHLNEGIKRETGLKGLGCMFLMLREKRKGNMRVGGLPWINMGWRGGGLELKAVRGVKDALREIEWKI